MHDETSRPPDPPVDAPAGSPADATPIPGPAAPVQRWRLTVARSADPPSQTQREVADAWEAAVGEAGLPVARTGDARSRPRISFGAPLPASVVAEAELIDLVLTERWPAWRVREALAPVVPAGWRLVDLNDVWLAGPPLPGRVAAADYRVAVAAAGTAGAEAATGGAIDRSRLARTCEVLLASRRIERERRKGESTVTYDLRPLLVSLGEDTGASGPASTVLRMRTRIHPELGTGRPDEVVAAVAEVMGEPLQVVEIVRERLVLIDELG